MSNGGFGTPGWFSDEALRKRAGIVPAIEERAWANLGALMGNLLSPPAEPGPPYVHTFVPPEPIGQDEDDNPIYPEPGPAYTLTERPLAELVDPDLPAYLASAALACDARQRLRRVADGIIGSAPAP